MTIKTNNKKAKLPTTSSTVNTSNKYSVIIKKCIKIYQNMIKNCKNLRKKLVPYKNHISALLMFLVVFIGILIFTAYVINIPINKNRREVTINTATPAIQQEIIKVVRNETILINSHILPVKTLENNIRKFIMVWFGKHDPVYVEKVLLAYMKLLKEEPKNKQNILYYIALCSAESNFRMSSRSTINGSTAAGAVGISQVRPTIWAKIVKENYGITRKELCTNIYFNIYAGYRIWDNYRRKGDGSKLSANTGYLGGNAVKYTNKINKRYDTLMAAIFLDLLNNKYTTAKLIAKR